ncbi:MAG: PEGA domain-containing protein [Lachnospiraceae bacterium]|nr:PEGA domain-containing protein [Lachnospiraceae bacterium]
MRQSVRKTLTTIMAAALLFAGTGAPVNVRAQENAAAQTTNTGAMSLLGKYDSADTATIVAVDFEQQLVRLFNHDRGRTYTLSYDNTSMIFDTNLQPLSARLLEPGTIVDLTFLKSTKHLNSLVVSRDAFSYTDVADYDLNAGVDTARVFGKFYKLTPMTLILAGSDRISLSGILPADTINVRGVGDEIYAITIAKGHGYISLSSDNVGDISLVGGWLELGSSYIRRITPGMFATVPEGTYELRIEGEGFDFTDEVTIERNRETVVDVSRISSSNARLGTVTFHTVPDTAEVYVDNERAMNDVPQQYTIGIHPLRVEAEGYTTMNAYLKVGRQEATINLNLRESSSAASTESSTGSTASTAASTAATEGTSSATAASTYATNTGASGSSTGATNASTSSTTASNAGTSATGGTWSNSGTGATNNNASNAASTVQAVIGNTASPGWVDTNPSTNNGGWIETDPNNNGTWVETDPAKTAVNGRRITFNRPEGAMVYFDGAYIGTTPTYIEKLPGLHTVTLRMDGYQTQTYTISVDDDDNNRTYNFPSLIAE